MYGKSVLLSRVARLGIVRNSSNSTKKLLEFLAEMPKANSGRIAEAQRQRQQISRKSEKYGPSTVYLQVIGSGARGAPNTLYLFTDQKRYLFNCGECTQRLAHEHKIKLSRLDHIFITSKSWKNIGGLPGLSLTLQDVGVPNITLHGPEGLDELYNATKRFVIMKDMNVTMAKCSPSEDFEDNVMSVKYVLLGPLDNILVGKDLKQAAKKPRLEINADKEFDEFIHDETDYYKPDVKNREASKSKYNKDKPKTKNSPEKDSMKKKTEKVLHELQKKTHCSVAYICTLKKRLGTLDLDKCVELGVKPGPMLGQLKSGQDVVLPNGNLVLSKDVKTPDDPGPVFIVLDVPEISYLKESEFSAHFDNGTNPPENIPTLVVHYSPPHVLHHPSYRAFMQMFGPATRHLVLNSQNSCLGSEAVHRTQHKLHLLDPDIFPLLKDASVPAVWNAHPPVPYTDSPVKLKGLEELKNKIALAQFQNIINMEGSCKGDGYAAGVGDDPELKIELLAARTLTMFHLRPKRQLDRSAEPKLHIQDYIQETMDVDGFVGSLEQFRRLVDSMRYAKSDSQKEYPKVVFLGTGSCIPSKTRNTSGIVLHVDENRSMLLDCGEGTFGQLVRFYGAKKVNSFLRTLKAIYISHLHADHHIGLIGVLQGRRQAFEEISQRDAPEPVYLLAPGQIVTWLSLYDQQFERIKADFTLIANQNLIQDSPNPNPDMTSSVLSSLGLQAIRTCLVSHCPNAFGVAIEMDGLYKITYSGDTIPCDKLVEIGDSSTLLIHEATMEDELAIEARIKMHSTTTQAIDIGRQMKARFTVLTHFSQRYARLPRLNAHILNDNKSVGIAFDNMQITMSDLELLPHMYAPLQLMFAEHCVELELKAAQRARIKERRSSSPVLPVEKKVVETDNANVNRKLSPCRVATSAPTATCRPKYRESNASRLRQEMKGMTVVGTTRLIRNSSSPIKSTSPGTPRSHTSGTVTPHARSDTSDAADTITTPRSISNSSSLSKDTQDRSKSNTTSSSGIVDTRSKTLSTASVKHPPTGDEVMDIMANHGKKKTSSLPSAHPPNISPPITNSGYGKPLVTPVNRKLTIRRDFPRELPTPQNRNNEKCNSGLKNTKKYPIKSWKAENSKSVSPDRSPNQGEIANKTKQPTKGNIFGNKLPCSNLNAKPDVKMAILKNNVATKPYSSTSSITNRSPTRLAKSIDGKTQDKFKTIKSDCHKDLKNRNPDCRRRSPARSFQNRMTSPSGSTKTSLDLERKSSGPRRDLLTEKIKQPFVRDIPFATNIATVLSRQCSMMHSNRSFKPQLEDIKSSYLLLNKKSLPHNIGDMNGRRHRPITIPGIPKPKPLNETVRKEQLYEIKKKFRSRQFLNNSRYDKIEGLNWISWK